MEWMAGTQGDIYEKRCLETGCQGMGATFVWNARRSRMRVPQNERQVGGRPACHTAGDHVAASTFPHVTSEMPGNLPRGNSRIAARALRQ